MVSHGGVVLYQSVSSIENTTLCSRWMVTFDKLILLQGCRIRTPVFTQKAKINLDITPLNISSMFLRGTEKKTCLPNVSVSVVVFLL